MHETNPFLIFTRRFDAIGVRYMITGSVAATIYGEPRLTNDVDVVAAVMDSQVGRLADVFPLSEFYLPPEEVIRVENARTHRGHFNIIHHASGFKADVYLTGRDSLHEWGMANARHVEVEGMVVSVAPPEYVVVRKLEFYREGGSEKHLNDIRAMLAGAIASADIAIIDAFAEERGLTEVWRTTRRLR